MAYEPKLDENVFRLDRLAKLYLLVRYCSGCGKPMILLTRNSAKTFRNVFPTYHKVNLEAQLKLAGLSLRSTLTDKEGDPICEKCEITGKRIFSCTLCEEARSSDQIQRRFGIYNIDYLCKICYESVSASTWRRKVEELEENHRWDGEG